MQRSRLLTTFTSAMGFAIGLFAYATANAADLSIGLKFPQPNVDPHYMTSPPAAQINSQVFEPLVGRDKNNAVEPKLAASWELVDDVTWVFHLRKDVKFSDGTPLTAADIVFTYGRAPNVPNSPASFANYLSSIAKIEVPDDYTLRITTKQPAPTLLENLSVILIVSKKHGEGATTEDYSSGKAMIGTGPYKFVSWLVNDNTVLEKNQNYWGPKATFDRVTYRMIQNDAARVAALLSGSVDVIEGVPGQEIERLKANTAVRIWVRKTSRVAYIAIDSGDEALAGGKITGPNGEKLDKNPLGNPKVREAMKLAIDTDAIVTRIFQGTAESFNQFMPTYSPSYNKDVKPWRTDPAAARKLLEESGWAGKFKLDLGTSADLLQNAVPVSEALAQSWTRIGIPTSVTQMPISLFTKTRNDRQMPIFTAPYQTQSDLAEALYPVLIHTRQPARGYGTLNYAFYSNTEVDKLIEEALVTMDNAKRAKLLQTVVALLDRDMLMMPMLLMSEVTGTKSSLIYTPRVDRYILPADFSPAQ